MDPMLVQYALFVLVALLIIGAVVALNRWLYRHSRPGIGDPITWAKLDTRRSEARDEAVSSLTLEEDEEDEAELQVRSRQNGHHSNGHKPLI